MIRLAKSSFYNETETKRLLVEFILKSERFSMGEQCEKFEKAFAKKQQTKHAIFVQNGSLANLVLIQSLLNLGLLKKGDKVGFSAVTWATNVMPIMQLGLVPVPIDCELDTLNISPEILLPKIDQLDALFITNVLGFADKLDEIRDICDSNNVLLLEDNCESLGSVLNDELLGNYGLASTFSFFVGHHLSTIEGGMICTNNDDLRDMAVMVRAHGWDRNLSSEKQEELRINHNVNEFYSKYTFYDLAYNCRPTEINGFIGNIQLNYLDEIVSIREANYKKFAEAINTNTNFISLKVDHMQRISNMAMPVVCKDTNTLKTYLGIFADAGIETRPLISGDITQQPFYIKYMGKSEILNNASIIHDQAFYFANNPELTAIEINTIVSTLTK